MDNRQKRTADSYQRILLYAERHPVQPEPPLLTRMRTSLERSLARIRGFHADQFSGGLPDARTLKNLRDRMRRERMMPLVRIAKPLLRFAPGSEPLMRIPHARTDTLTLALHAQKMAKLFAPHTKLLVAAGYSKTFVAEFRKEADELAAAAKYSENVRLNRGRATLALKRELEKAAKTAMVIEGILMAQMGGFRKMREWRMMRRVTNRIGRPPRRKRKETPAPLM